MVSLFRRSNVDSGNVGHEQLSQLLLRRLDFLEYDRLTTFESIVSEHDNRFDSLSHRVNLLEAAVNRGVQRNRMLEPEPSLTADMAEQAPMWTEGSESQLPLPAPIPPLTSGTPIATANMLASQLVALTEPANQYGSGAPPGAPAPGPSTDLLTFTPPSTPRQQSTQQSPIAQEPNADREPLWGKNFLQFQKRVVELEKNHNKMQDLLDTLGALVEGFSDPIHPLKQVHDSTVALEAKMKYVTAKVDQVEIKVANIDHKLTEVLDAQRLQPPQFGQEPLVRDPWASYHEELRPSRQLPVPPPPKSFAIHGQCNSPTPQEALPQLGFAQPQPGFQSPPAAPYIASPLGAAIHAAEQLVHGWTDKIPNKPFEIADWKISPKVDKDRTTTGVHGYASSIGVKGITSSTTIVIVYTHAGASAGDGVPRQPQQLGLHFHFLHLQLFHHEL